MYLLGEPSLKRLLSKKIEDETTDESGQILSSLQKRRTLNRFGQRPVGTAASSYY